MSRGRALVGLTGLTLLSCLPAAAKPPEVTALSPAGARSGTTVLVTATGTFSNWPARPWTDDPGLTVTPATEKGRFWVTVAEGVTPGVHWVRFADAEGATALRPFAVGRLPEVAEVEPNDDPGKAQAIGRTPPAVTVNGRLARNGDVDGFAVELRRGETLVAAVEANNRLGAPMDALLQVARPDGIVLADNDDDRGRDPFLVFRAPADGTYVVRTFAFPATPDSRIGFSGGSAFLYRLTLTAGPFLDHAFPLAVSRDNPGPVHAEGWNVSAGDAPLSLLPDGDRARATHPSASGDAAVRVVPHAAAAEHEPNPPGSAEEVSPPVSVSGRFDGPKDVDAFRFRARKGDRLAVRAESQGFGQSLDLAVRVIDPAGKVVSEADDSRGDRDPALTFTAPADGEYRATVRELYGQCGPRAVYLLTLAPPLPDVKLTVPSDRLTAETGKPLKVTVTLERTEGFDGRLAVTVEGLPEGVTAAPVVSEPKGATARSVSLELKADVAKLAGGWSGPVTVVGRVEKGDGPVRLATAKVDGVDRPTPHLWLTVTAPKPAPKSK